MRPADRAKICQCGYLKNSGELAEAWHNTTRFTHVPMVGQMEQRKYPRFPVRFRSSFTSLNIVGGDGKITDLSLRGCRVESPTEVRPGTSLELRVHVSDDEPPLKILEAVVRWSRAQQFGLQFVTLDPEEWARLQHTVTQLELHPYQQESTPDDSSHTA
jgi:hypothetical protein